MITGYTTGVFDLFHIGHLNVLRNAKGACDRLIVGVSTDELVLAQKNKNPDIPYHDREEMVRSLRFVDVVVSQADIDKFEAWKRLEYDVLFVGDDWYGTDSWKEYERKFKEKGVKIVYFPRTPGISTTARKSRFVQELR